MKVKFMCVHTRHCCRIHGCKYGEENSCAVWLGYKSQEFSCESCGGVTPKVKFSEFQKRNDEADNNSSWDEF